MSRLLEDKPTSQNAIGPTSEGLEALWNRYRSRTRRLLSPGVFRELSLQSRFFLRAIDPSSVVRELPRGAVPDCASCLDLCCGGLTNTVSLRLVDIAKLIDLKREDLITKKKPRFPEALLSERPHLRSLSNSFLFRALPILRQIGPGRTCQALTNQGRCSLYPNWPTSCARFPYTLDPTRRTVRWGSRCGHRDPVPDRARADDLLRSATSAYNERVKDAVLVTHATPELKMLGVGHWLTAPKEDPFERSAPLPVLADDTYSDGSASDG